ncbi:hypothetical protein BH09SUM1_BH09SUM1_16880 [soil metagenome]
MLVRDSTIDYIFTDPPFGENIYYADMNFLFETWQRVISHARLEAIIDRHKKKGLAEYKRLMEACFREYNYGSDRKEQGEEPQVGDENERLDPVSHDTGRLDVVQIIL